jgi:hypothetical protein
MVEVRKRRGPPNDSNVIRIVCAAWRDWLKKAPKRDRVQMPEPHGNGSYRGKRYGETLAFTPAMRQRNRSKGL